MNHDAAPTSLRIKIVTGAILGLIGLFLVLSYWYVSFLVAVAVAGGISVLCYLWSPMAYEVSDHVLTVLFRRGSKEFGTITDCNPVPKKLGMTLRLWGNGGLFAVTGIFWNRRWGTFRAYLTTSDHANLVLVDTADHKVLVSPADASGFIADSISGSQKVGNPLEWKGEG